MRLEAVGVGDVIAAETSAYRRFEVVTGVTAKLVVCGKHRYRKEDGTVPGTLLLNGSREPLRARRATAEEVEIFTRGR